MLRGEQSFRLTAGRWQHTLKDQYEYVQVEKTPGGVGLIRLNRPKALNALCDDLFKDLLHVSFLKAIKNTMMLVWFMYFHH
jgi:hypothetical protein